VETSAPRSVLVVDDSEACRAALRVALIEAGYDCFVASNAPDALEVAQDRDLSLVVTDLDMPHCDGLWLLGRLKQSAPGVPVIFLSARSDVEVAVDCLRDGAADYLVKPLRVSALLEAVERAIAVRQAHAESRQKADAELSLAAQAQTAWALLAALEAREDETSRHSQRVVHYTTAIAEALGIRGNELQEIGRGALLHDIGKIGIPDAVLLKPQKLTSSEWAQMRKHPEIGYQMIRNIEFLSTAASIVLAHQERWDGGGYPKHLRGQEIPIGARVFAVADTFDAMTSDRPYRSGSSFASAIAEIQRCGGSQFDPEVTRAFLSLGESRLTGLRQGVQAAIAARAKRSPPTLQPALLAS